MIKWQWSLEAALMSSLTKTSDSIGELVEASKSKVKSKVQPKVCWGVIMLVCLSHLATACFMYTDTTFHHPSYSLP